ncbi:MAG TPA: radical SAM protein [Terriglobales bacterium]|nr:radical SAM protein [Terriglobales bacterium]
MAYEKLERPEQYISKVPSLGTRTINYISSQGCPFRCQFCAEPLVYQRRWKAYTADRVLADLEFLQSFLDINGVTYHDPNFFVNERRAREIAEKKVERGVKPAWSACARSSQVVKFSDETYKALRASGLRSFFMGVESGSNEVLGGLQKDICMEDSVEAARVATKNGIYVSCSFIVGFPGETETEMNETWNMMEQISVIIGEFSSDLLFYAPVPGHSLYEKACEMGFERPASLEEWARFRTTDPKLPWMSEKLTNRMKQRHFYFTYGYPAKAVRRRSAGNLPLRAYFAIANRLSSARCRHQYWKNPLDWWILQGLKFLFKN